MEIWFKTVGASISLEGIGKLDTIGEYLAWQIFDTFFFLNIVQWQYSDCELWGNNKLFLVMGNIMPQMKQFKNSSNNWIPESREDGKLVNPIKSGIPVGNYMFKLTIELLEQGVKFRTSL